MADWSLNTHTREWCYRDGTRVSLEKTDGTTAHILKEKLIQQALAVALPSETQIERSMQDLIDAKTAVQSLLMRDLEAQNEKSQAKIK